MVTRPSNNSGISPVVGRRFPPSARDSLSKNAGTEETVIDPTLAATAVALSAVVLAACLVYEVAGATNRAAAGAKRIIAARRGVHL